MDAPAFSAPAIDAEATHEVALLLNTLIRLERERAGAIQEHPTGIDNKPPRQYQTIIRDTHRVERALIARLVGAAKAGGSVQVVNRE